MAQPVEVAVWAGDKTVESGGDEDGRLGGHGRAHIGRGVGQIAVRKANLKDGRPPAKLWP